MRNSNSSKNIPDGLNNPLDVFSLFFDDDILDSIVTCTNDYATHLLSQPEMITWLENHPSSRFTKWPDEGISYADLRSKIGLMLNIGFNKDKLLP